MRGLALKVTLPLDLFSKCQSPLFSSREGSFRSFTYACLVGIVLESPVLAAAGPSGEWLEPEPDFVERHTKDMDVVFPEYKH